MPTTINGIGTHYYGKKNVSVRNGACQSCGRVGNLTSYDTRLWFVVVFVPVIPLGRKRIIDQCPACRRHYAADQDQFAMARQLSLSGARDKFATEPTVEVASGVHAQMLGFHAHEEARSFRDEVLAKFPHDAPLRANLASQLDEVGEYDAATPLYEQAYGLDPSLPQARDGVALRRIVDGRLDDARQLLDFLERPGAGQLYPLGRLEQLAEAYQKRGRHEEMLALAAVLIREFPQVANNHRFRKFVAKSEKATHSVGSILPERKTSWRALFDTQNPAYSAGQRWATFLAIAAVLIVVVMAGTNEYRRRNRTVHVRNEFGDGAKVVIDGEVVVPTVRQAEIALPEGKHHVSVTGLIDEEFDVDMATDYWQRWTNNPAWVINVGGAAPLMNQRLHYAVHPRPAETTLAAGENLLFMPHVDYLFKSAPQSIEVESQSGEVIKYELSVANESPVEVFLYLTDNGSTDSAFHFAESQLLIDPSNDELLRAYLRIATEAGQTERAKDFLGKQFDRRPVLVNWHRMFHQLHTTAAEKTELINTYDRLLAADPNSGALLYLRGRLTPEKSTAAEFYNRAIAADPQLSYPWMALGHQAFTSGNWLKAKDYTERAQQLQPHRDNEAIIELARLALGDGGTLEQEYRDRLDAGNPLEALPIVMKLSNVLVARGDAAGAKQVIADWEAKIPAEAGVQSALENYRGIVELTTGDLAAVGQRVSEGTASPDLRLAWLANVGKPDEAANDGTLATLLENPWNALMLSLSFDVAGETNEAQKWREKAATGLAKLDFDDIAVAEMLNSNAPPTMDQVANLGTDPSDKSLLLAVLARRFREQGELAEMANRFLVLPSGYRPLVKKSLGEQP